MDREIEHDGPAMSSVAAAQELAVTLLATGRLTYAEVGQQIGKSERSIQRWMADAVFARRIGLARAEMVHQTTGRLQALAVTSTDVLELSLRSESSSERLTAVRITLTAAPRYFAVGELDARVLAIENAAEGIDTTDEGADQDQDEGLKQDRAEVADPGGQESDGA